MTGVISAGPEKSGPAFLFVRSVVSGLCRFPVFARFPPQSRPLWHRVYSRKCFSTLRGDNRMLIFGANASRGFVAGLMLLGLAACGSGDTDGRTAPVAAAPENGGIAGQAVPDPSDGGFEGNISNTVYFETDSYALTSEAQAGLQKQAAWLTRYPVRTFTIEGHADERGTREYNLGLGERRANAIGNYFVALGIDKSRISVISFGKERPLCSEATEECWSQNRRGVTSINQ
jgi:peptidoglycan-associated lipoprotein